MARHAVITFLLLVATVLDGWSGLLTDYVYDDVGPQTEVSDSECVVTRTEYDVSSNGQESLERWFVHGSGWGAWRP